MKKVKHFPWTHQFLRMFALFMKFTKQICADEAEASEKYQSMAIALPRGDYTPGAVSYATRSSIFRCNKANALRSGFCSAEKDHLECDDVKSRCESPNCSKQSPRTLSIQTVFSLRPNNEIGPCLLAVGLRSFLLQSILIGQMFARIDSNNSWKDGESSSNGFDAHVADTLR